jgi:molecular chaperone DnaK
MASGPVVGIDLGTTNTVVAVMRNGQAAALADESGSKLIPSVVSFHPSGTVLVGQAAKERRLVDTKNTIYSIKRLIGRSWDSEEVRKARSRFPFEMREGPGQAALVEARGETYTLPEISAFVLRRAKAVAEAALGTAVERAVITVPANFNDLQRAATKVAGRVAGIEVLRILNEPTAAALAYGHGRGASERLAVYDFGGGTFDVTLLDLSDNVFEVLATAGNTFLGGDDVDMAIAERMADQFLTRHHYDPRSDPQAFEQLKNAAEQIKLRLSAEAQASIEIADVAQGSDGQPLTLQYSMTRRALEEIVGALVDQTFEVCSEALRIARLTASDFDQVLLVGGSTRIPYVRSRVEEFFHRTPLGHISPDEVVAIGAAIQGSALAGTEKRRSDVPRAPKPARTTGSAVFSEPNTEPYGARPRLQTSPGLNPERGAARGGAALGPIVAPAPGSMPGSAVPFTVDAADRGARNTQNRVGERPPETVAGLGPRAKIPTGAGLGPAAEQARQRAHEGTLMSASDAAARARAAVEAGRKKLPSMPDAGVPLPLVGTDDALVDDSTHRSHAAARTGGYELELELGEEEPTLDPRTPAARPAPAFGAALLGKRTEESVPAFVLSDLDLEEDSGLIQSGQLRQMTAPASTEEVTEVHRRGITGPRIQIDESSLPIPEAPRPAGEEEQLTARPAARPAAGRRATGRVTGAGSGRITGPNFPGASGTVPLPAVALGGTELPALGAPAPAWAAQPAPVAPAAPVIQELPPSPPLLVDVTPLSLSVETVSGYCDTIIARNTPVPCERSRSFVTAVDNQTSVRVRVSQGESQRFGENTLLGELELNGLRPASRGQVSIEVRFSLDTDGILSVSARDVATGNATEARVRLIGMPDTAQVAHMTARHQTHSAGT